MWIPKGSYYTDFFTGMKFWGNNIDNNTYMGTLYITWYVMFKGYSP